MDPSGELVIAFLQLLMRLHISSLAFWISSSGKGVFSPCELYALQISALEDIVMYFHCLHGKF